MKRNKQNGITLIALVITIIVLLILAGVSIATLTGQNGILAQASQAKLNSNHSSVLEALQLENESYEIEKNTTNNSDTIVTYLLGKNIIDGNKKVNVSVLLGKQLSTGNGLSTTDVYIVEESSDNKYILVYYDEQGNKTEVGNIGNKVRQATDEEFFDISNGSISIKKEYGYYTENWDNWTLEELVIPDTIRGEKVKYLSSGFIGNNTKIKSVIIPEGIETIGTNSFIGCTNLTNVTIPESVTAIESGAFEECTNLTNITIPEGVRIIESGAFKGCLGLTQITIPESVEEIGYILSDCYRLRNITILSGNVDIKEIGVYPFLMSSFTVTEKSEKYSTVDGILMDKLGTTLIAYPSLKENEIFEIPSTVSTIKSESIFLYNQEFYKVLEEIRNIYRRSRS